MATLYRNDFSSSAKSSGDVFVVQHSRVVEGSTPHDESSECFVTFSSQLSEAIRYSDQFISLFEDCRPGVEIWLGDQCVFLAGTSENCPPFMKGGSTYPMVPGRYRWDEGTDVWHLVGPV